jgi:hypothetical protein
MGRAIGDVLPVVAIAVFPVPIIAVVLFLGSERRQANGVAFVLAWLAGLAGVGVIVLLLAGEADASDAGEPTRWVDAVLLVLGLLLLAAAVKGWVGRPRDEEEAPMPAGCSIDGFNTAKAAGAGFALGTESKNVLLVVAGHGDAAGLRAEASDRPGDLRSARLRGRPDFALYSRSRATGRTMLEAPVAG